MTDEAPLELFGAPVGLFTGKVRSYLRKQGIAYVERLPSDRAGLAPLLGLKAARRVERRDFLETWGEAVLP